MHSERDYLREHAFRRLDLRLREYGYSLFVMDLRGSSEDDETISFEKRVLQMCLRRVTDCKPRMIGILGDRYGWIFLEPRAVYPDELSYLRAQKVAFDIADRHDLPREAMEGISVTHLEILHGLQQTDTSKSFFYWRNPLPYATMPPADKDVFAPDNPVQTALLKQYIESIADKTHIHKYSPLYRENAPLSRLEQLDEMVEADLWDSFYSEILENEGRVIEPHQAYLTQKALLPMKLPAYDRIAEAISDGTNVLIEGAAGSGKSVLIGQLYADMRAKEKTIVFCCGLNAASRDESEMLLQLCGQLSDSDTFPQKLADRRAFFWELLEKSSPLFVFIDSIDSLQTASNAGNTLGFLPENTIPGVLFILSAKPGAVSYIGSLPFYVEKLSALSSETAVQMTQSISELFAKGLGRDVLTAAANHIVEAGGLPLYARILTEQLCQMTGADYNAFSGNDAHIRWMLSQTEQMPLTVPGAYQKILERAGDVYGEQALWMMKLIAVSRNGLPSGLLLAAAAELSSDISDIAAFEIRDFFFGHLRQDTDLFWWEFEHQQFRECLLLTMTEDERRRLHGILLGQLEILEGMEDYRFAEYLYHCDNAGLGDKAVNFIADETIHHSILDPVMRDLFEYDDFCGGSFTKDMLDAARDPAIFTEPDRQGIFYIRIMSIISGQLKGETVGFPYLRSVTDSVRECARLFQFTDSKRDSIIYPFSIYLSGWLAELSGETEEAEKQFSHSAKLLEKQAENGLIGQIGFTIYTEINIRRGDFAYRADDFYSARYYYELARDVILALDSKSDTVSYGDLIKIEMYLARLSEKEKKDEERGEHYRKAVALCDAAMAAGDFSVRHTKSVLLREFSDDSNEEPNAAIAYQIAKKAYLANPDNVPALLSYADACGAASKEASDVSYAHEAFPVLLRECQNNPGRPNVLCALAELTVTLAGLENKDTALDRCREILAFFEYGYDATEELIFAYLLLLRETIPLCRETGEIQEELRLRRKMVMVLEDKKAENANPGMVLMQRIIFLWETIEFCRDILKDERQMVEFAHNLQTLLLSVKSQNLADTPELKAQLSGKFYGLGMLYYQERGDRAEAYRFWGLSADVLDELNLYYPGNADYMALRQNALTSIVGLLARNHDKGEKEWKKRLKAVSKR